MKKKMYIVGFGIFLYLICCGISTNIDLDFPPSKEDFSNDQLSENHLDNPRSAEENVTLKLQFLYSNGANIGANRIVNFTNTSASFSKLTTNTGNLTISLENNTIWQIEVYIVFSAGIYMKVLNTTLNVDEENLYIKYICDLKTVRMRVRDYNNVAVSGAIVNITNKENLEYSKVGITDYTGYAYIGDLYNSTWTIHVYYQIGDMYYKLYQNLNYLISTYTYYRDVSIYGSNTNLTQITITAVDKEILDPEYNTIYNANISLYNNTNGAYINSYFTNIYGQVNISIPRLTFFNFTCEYRGISREFFFNTTSEASEYTKQFWITTNHKLTMNITFENEINTKITIKNITFEKPADGKWDASQAQSAQISQKPYYINLFMNDSVTISLNFSQAAQDGPSITEAGGNWNFVRFPDTSNPINGSLDLNPIKEGTGGIYNLTIFSKDYFCGEYLLTINLNKSTEDVKKYQDSTIFITLNFLNHTTQLLQSSPDPNLGASGLIFTLNSTLDICVNYTSVLPTPTNLSNAVFNYKIEGTNVEGELTHISDGIYNLSVLLTLNDINEGLYLISIFGNQTDFAYQSIQIGVQILPIKTLCNLNIPSDFKINTNYLKTSLSENITFSFNYTDTFGIPFETYSDVSISVINDGDKDLPFSEIGSNSGNYNCSELASDFILGMHQVEIVLSKPNFETQTINFQIEIIDYWNTQVNIIHPPDSVIWNNNLSFVISYISIEEPRLDRTLNNGNITKLQVSYKADQSILPYAEFLFDDIQKGVWFWEEIGSGQYKLFVNSSYLNVSISTIYYFTPIINVSVYRNASQVVFSIISPLQTSMSIVNQANQNEELTYIEIERNDELLVDVFYYVMESKSVLNGMNISNAYVYSTVSNISNGSTFSSDQLSWSISRNAYQFTLSSSNLTSFVGTFRIEITIVLMNFTQQSKSFTLVIGQEFPLIVTNITQSIKLNPNTIKLSQSENISFSIELRQDLIINTALIDVKMDGNSIFDIFFIPINSYAVYVEFNSSGYIIGSHQINIVIQYPGFYNGSKDIDVIIIEQWFSVLEVIEAGKTYPWGQNASVILRFYCNEDPRRGEIISGAVIQNISIYSQNFSQIINLVESERTLKWDYYELISEENFGPGYYYIWFLTNIVAVENKTIFYVDVATQKSPFRNGTSKALLWIQPIETQFILTDSGVRISNGQSLSLEIGEMLILSAVWNVDDPYTLIGDLSISNANVSMTLFNNSEILNQWPLSYSSPSKTYSNNFEMNDTGIFIVSVFAQRTNYTQKIIDFTIVVGIKQVNYSVDIDPFIKLDDFSIKVAQSENITFNISFSQLDGSIPSIFVWLDENPVLNIQQISQSEYNCTVKVENLIPGNYKLRIYGETEKNLPKEMEFNVIVIENWATRVDFIQPPLLTPWNNNISFIIRYQCIELPRSELIQLENSTISDVLLRNEDRSIQFLLDSSTRGILWNYENLKDISQYGPGYYRVIINSSILSVQTISAYYVIPTIVQDDYTVANKSSYILIQPIQNTIHIFKSDTNQTLIDQIIIPLENTTKVIVYLNNTHQMSIDYKNPITIANLSYQIRYFNNNSLFKTGKLNSTGSGIYQAELYASISGKFILTISNSLLNYSLSNTSIIFEITPKPLIISLDPKFVDREIAIPINRDLSFEVTLIDPKTNEKIIHANVTMIFNNKLYHLLDEETPGTYKGYFDASDFEGLNENQGYPIELTIVKDDYEVQELKLNIFLTFAIDPYFNIPYRYIIIIGSTMGAILAISLIRKRIIIANTPFEIKLINKTKITIKKQKKFSAKDIAPSQVYTLIQLYQKDWAFLDLDMKNALNFTTPSDTQKNVLSSEEK